MWSFAYVARVDGDEEAFGRVPAASEGRRSVSEMIVAVPDDRFSLFRECFTGGTA
jgi:hypothetical protein